MVGRFVEQQEIRLGEKDRGQGRRACASRPKIAGRGRQLAVGIEPKPSQDPRRRVPAPHRRLDLRPAAHACRLSSCGSVAVSAMREKLVLSVSAASTISIKRFGTGRRVLGHATNAPARAAQEMAPPSGASSPAISFNSVVLPFCRSRPTSATLCPAAPRWRGRSAPGRRSDR